MKKILISLVAVLAVVAGVATMSAFEAHVINVTAKIENALSVDPMEIDFGTVFPQEYLERIFTVRLSDSFQEEGRVDDVHYVIRQKPKPIWEEPAECGQDFADIDEARAYCHDNYPQVPYDPQNPDWQNYLDCCYLSLCPYLSKLDGDPEDNNDTGVPSYYVPATSTPAHCQTPVPEYATGFLSKLAADISDLWTVDLKVPPVAGFVGQDWPVDCPTVAENEQEYGCDLWIEVTDVSLPDNGDIGCLEKADVMLVLDRSGSIDSGELTTLKTAALAFVTALSPSTDGVHMGQTSFSTNGTLDLHLTASTSDINAAINGLSSGGNTNLGEGISLADTELDNPGDGDDRPDAESPDFLVIITDGNPTAGSPNPEDAGINAANAAKADGIVIYVVGVGTTTATTDYLKDNIATSASHYFDAADWSNLQTILEDLATCD